MGRYGELKKLTRTMEWLCSEASSFGIGVVVSIDGRFSGVYHSAISKV